MAFFVSMWALRIYLDTVYHSILLASYSYQWYLSIDTTIKCRKLLDFFFSLSTIYLWSPHDDFSKSHRWSIIFGIRDLNGPYVRAIIFFLCSVSMCEIQWFSQFIFSCFTIRTWNISYWVHFTPFCQIGYAIECSHPTKNRNVCRFV